MWQALPSRKWLPVLAELSLSHLHKIPESVELLFRSGRGKDWTALQYRPPTRDPHSALELVHLWQFVDKWYHIGRFLDLQSDQSSRNVGGILRFCKISWCENRETAEIPNWSCIWMMVLLRLFDLGSTVVYSALPRNTKSRVKNYPLAQEMLLR